MEVNKSDHAPTLLAKYRAEHQTPVARLARDFGVTRNYIYHLLDPSDPLYIAHRPSVELLRRVAARVKRSLRAVEEDLARFEQRGHRVVSVPRKKTA